MLVPQLSIMMQALASVLHLTCRSLGAHPTPSISVGSQLRAPRSDALLKVESNAHRALLIEAPQRSIFRTPHTTTTAAHADSAANASSTHDIVFIEVVGLVRLVLAIRTLNSSSRSILRSCRWSRRRTKHSPPRMSPFSLDDARGAPSLPFTETNIIARAANCELLLLATTHACSTSRSSSHEDALGFLTLSL